MNLHTPAQLEELTGLSTASQRAWRAAGLLKRGVQTDGGHWRFRRADVLYVALAKVIAEMGFDLTGAAPIAEMCLGEVSDRLQGREVNSDEKTHPYVFVWRIHDSAKTAASMVGGVLHPIPNSEHCVVRLAELSRITAFSQAGGFVLIPEDLARKIPVPVAELFSEAL